MKVPARFHFSPIFFQSKVVGLLDYSAETEIPNEGEDTTPPDEAPDAVAPSEEL